MGQYYYILMKEENKKSAVYNRDLIVNGKKEYTFAKLKSFVTLQSVIVTKWISLSFISFANM